MKTSILTMIVIFLLFLGSIAYVTWHLSRLMPGGWAPKLCVALLYLLWMASFFASMGLRNQLSTATVTVLYEVGHPWLIAHLYLLLGFVVADVAVLVKILPKAWMAGNGITLATFLGAVAIVMLLGGIHYKHKYREELTLDAGLGEGHSMTVVLASDLHLGYSNRKAEFSRWVDLINAENPDLVLFGGDIVDISLKPILEGNFAEEFARIKAPMYTVLGNHEYIGHEDEAEDFFMKTGITLLRDSVAHVGNLTIIGRDDRSNRHRLPLQTLKNQETSEDHHFTILLDHQPYNLEEAEAAGIGFQFSGHTHRGQIWPGNWFTDAMYEKSWGHHQRGNTRYYVSSGLGIWGPKIRIGTRSEYLVLHLK